jgi:hypothetical protein
LEIKTISNELGRRLDRAMNSHLNLLKILDSDGGWTWDGYPHAPEPMALHKNIRSPPPPWPLFPAAVLARTHTVAPLLPLSLR